MLSAGFGIHESPALNFLFRLSGQGQARVGPGHRWSEKYLSVLTTGLAYHWPTLARPNIGLTLGPGQRPTLVTEGRPGLLRTLVRHIWPRREGMEERPITTQSKAPRRETSQKN